MNYHISFLLLLTSIFVFKMTQAMSENQNISKGAQDFEQVLRENPKEANALKKQLHRKILLESLNAVQQDNQEVLNRLLKLGRECHISVKHVVDISLFQASASNAKKSVVFLLQFGANPNAEYRTETPLHIACKKRYLEITEALLNHGADVNKEGGVITMEGGPSDGKTLSANLTPLHLACENGGHLELAQLLIKHGADFTKRCGVGFNALYYAAHSNNFKLVEYLMEQGADLSTDVVTLKTQSPFVSLPILELIASKTKLSLKKNPFMPCKRFIIFVVNPSNYSNTDSYRSFTQTTEGKQTILRWAIQQNCKPLVEKLLLSTDINKKDPYGRTPLMHAAANGNTAIMQLILSTQDPQGNSVALTVKDQWGNSALDHALRWRNIHAAFQILKTLKLKDDARRAQQKDVNLVTEKTVGEVVLDILYGHFVDKELESRENYRARALVAKNWLQ